jgi:CubicO group peptidase (beta-lactamase class C family)
MFGLFAMENTLNAAAPEFDKVDAIIEKAIADGNCPNADLIVGRGDKILYQKFYGMRSVKPEPQPMAPGLVFDLASLTKPVATATSIMILHERGKINVADPVAKYMPTFAQNGKGHVTIEQCLLHTAGFIADNPLSDYADGGNIAIERIKVAPLEHPTGKSFVYSDVGYIVLGELIRVVDGRTVDQFADDEIFKPLLMLRTGFRPDFKLLTVPTADRNGIFTAGEVHDPRALAMGGVAGHAGLFGTASDLAKFCQMILAGGVDFGGRRMLKAETVAMMTQPRPAPNPLNLRTYGFDSVSRYDSPRGAKFTKGKSFGHTGYTGGSIWIDPDSGVFIILLTSRLHPDGKGDVKQLRYDVATAVAVAFGL